MRSVVVLLATVAVALAASSAPLRAEGEHDRVVLVVARATGTGACPNDAELSARVRARLGFDPFANASTPAARRLRVELAPAAGSRDGAMLEARIALTASDGTSRGRRVLRGDVACDELANDLVLAIAIAIDPLLLMRRSQPPDPSAPVQTESTQGAVDDVALRAPPAPKGEQERRDILPGESELPPQWAPVAAAGGAALGYGVGILAGAFLTGGSNAANSAWSHSAEWNFILVGLGVPILPAVVIAFSTTFMFMDVRASAAVAGVTGAVLFASHAALLAIGVTAPPGSAFEGVALVTITALVATAAGATAVMMPQRTALVTQSAE